MFKYEKILRMLEGGKSADEVAKTFKVSRQYVYSVNNKYGKDKISTGVEKKAKKAKVMAKINEEFDKQYEKFQIKKAALQIPLEQMRKDVADMINHPPHYKVGGIETIDFIEAKGLGYNLGNVVKYITRADHKGHREQDLNKALWYLLREIDKHSEV